MAKSVSMILGIGFLLMGVLGFVMPGLLGAHLNLAHNLVHIITGAVALYFGTKGTLTAARTFCILFGLVYGLLGLTGMLMGKPDTSSIAGMGEMGMDGKMLKIIPGVLEFGTADHFIHIALGALFLIGGLLTKTSDDFKRR